MQRPFQPTSGLSLHLPTAKSLVAWVGIGSLATIEVRDGHNGDNRARLNHRLLMLQMGILQRIPKPLQMQIYCEVAATYLPELVDLWRQSTDGYSSVIELMNAVSTSPYFVRFMRSEAAVGLVYHHAHLVATNFTKLSTMTMDEIASTAQLLWTLLVLQAEGIDEVADADKNILVARMPEWVRKYPGRSMSEVAERCIGILTKQPAMVFLAKSVGGMLIEPFSKCGAPGCYNTTRADGTDLLQCGRCKSALYCDVAHQLAAWPKHKSVCFAVAF
ncbi:hypothetical protein MKEN_01350000 [Mycena kentingensis (nom. inval.)]|nr:hypothetical protein MKEN_01350000 [Mycena kentingensis (nom. inval.)]